MSDSAMRTIVPLGTIEFSPRTVARIEEVLEMTPSSHLDKTLVTYKKFDEDKFTYVLRLIVNRGKDVITRSGHTDNSCTVLDLWQEISWDKKLEDTAANYEAWNFNLYAAVNVARKISAPL